MRVLQNLVTCDWNLMLSSGLPMSAEPGPVAEIGQKFAAQATAQSPGDLRVTALVELASLVRKVTRKTLDSSGRRLDAYDVRRLNTDMDDWERSWTPRLRNTEAQHCSLPFTSLRWCRLALNSAQLDSVLAPPTSVVERSVKLPVLQSLEISVEAALNILLSLSEAGAGLLSDEQASQVSCRPSGPLKLDRTAVERLGYAVDSTWISHTFAIAFIVLAYIRGAIDGMLRLCLTTVHIAYRFVDNLDVSILTPPSNYRSRAPAHPRPAALLIRVASLALDIFRAVAAAHANHPVHDFLPAVENVAGLVLKVEQGPESYSNDMRNTAGQDLFDFMNDTGVDWPSIFYNTDTGWSESDPFG